ncbi:hypothetical protein C8R43DRAFT_316902 [Mycena crocata]|nr:hypothetical protein C8R43DRAFT_316902 [Mycena crocata]
MEIAFPNPLLWRAISISPKSPSQGADSSLRRVAGTLRLTPSFDSIRFGSPSMMRSFMLNSSKRWLITINAGSTCSWFPYPYSAHWVSALSYRGFCQLTSLFLARVEVEPCGSILHHTPNLTHCNLRLYRNTFKSVDPIPPLRFLRSLRLWEHLTVSHTALFDALTLPVLRTLDVVEGFLGSPNSYARGVCEVFCMSSQGIGHPHGFRRLGETSGQCVPRDKFGGPSIAFSSTRRRVSERQKPGWMGRRGSFRFCR